MTFVIRHAPYEEQNVPILQIFYFVEQQPYFSELGISILGFEWNELSPWNITE